MIFVTGSLDTAIIIRSTVEHLYSGHHWKCTDYRGVLITMYISIQELTKLVSSPMSPNSSSVSDNRASK